ncbi:MAG: orotidine-5'-phosphate decarboxylase [Myxococcota bacterium]
MVHELFADRLVTRQRALGHPLCVGLDPHLGRIPESFRRGTMAPSDPDTAAAVETFLAAVVARLEGRVAAVKPQIAFFEQLGWRGLQVLERLVARCHEHELLVIMDAKRGDIGSTAAGYARAFLGRDAPWGSDALTVNPYLGLDTLEPFLDAAASAGAGLFVLVKTSNPGSDDLQRRHDGAGHPLYLTLAAALEQRAARLAGTSSGFSGLGAVVGATYPDDARRVREVMPHGLLLVPGFGAQGASAADSVAGFVRGPHGLEGGVVNASRSIVFPSEEGKGASRAPWSQRFDDALARACADLADAVA